MDEAYPDVSKLLIHCKPYSIAVILKWSVPLVVAEETQVRILVSAAHQILTWQGSNFWLNNYIMK